ncbi:MAG: guanylate kinase [Pseudomonadota bacterium]
MLVLSSPSGAGKSTIARALLSEDQDLSLSVSVTTRERRHSEIDGRDYHFLSHAQFESIRDSGGLLEWAQVHGNFYGSPLEPVQRALAEGRDMLFDIDWQGALQMFEKARADIVSVFILPPSMEELRARLQRRAEDSQEVIERRLKNAAAEISHWRDYDYVLINRDLNKTFDDVKAILRAERLRQDRRTGMHGFVDTLIVPA